MSQVYSSNCNISLKSSVFSCVYGLTCRIFVVSVTCTAVILNVKEENGGDEKLSIRQIHCKAEQLWPKTLSLDFFIEVVCADFAIYF